MFLLKMQFFSSEPFFLKSPNNVRFTRGTFLSPLKEASTLSASFEGIMSELRQVNNPNIDPENSLQG